MRPARRNQSETRNEANESEDFQAGCMLSMMVYGENLTSTMGLYYAFMKESYASMKDLHTSIE